MQGSRYGREREREDSNGITKWELSRLQRLAEKDLGVMMQDNLSPEKYITKLLITGETKNIKRP